MAKLEYLNTRHNLISWNSSNKKNKKHFYVMRVWMACLGTKQKGRNIMYEERKRERIIILIGAVEEVGRCLEALGAASHLPEDPSRRWAVM